MVAATLCGITDPHKVGAERVRVGTQVALESTLGGFPSEQFLTQVDPLLAGVREKSRSDYATVRPDRGLSISLLGRATWAQAWYSDSSRRIRRALGCHGAGCHTEDMVNVVGTSTCIIGDHPRGESSARSLRSGGRSASTHSRRDRGRALCRRRYLRVRLPPAPAPTWKQLFQGPEHFRGGQTGLLRFTWDNGDRTVLVNAELGGITLGWSLMTRPRTSFLPRSRDRFPHANHPRPHGGARGPH